MEYVESLDMTVEEVARCVYYKVSDDSMAPQLTTGTTVMMAPIDSFVQIKPNEVLYVHRAGEPIRK